MAKTSRSCYVEPEDLSLIRSCAVVTVDWCVCREEGKGVGRVELISSKHTMQANAMLSILKLAYTTCDSPALRLCGRSI